MHPAPSDPKKQPSPGTQPKRNPDEKELDTQDEYIKNILAKMIEENPAGVAEIIHMWLNQDKQRNE